MSSISEKLDTIKKSITALSPKPIKLIAISKYSTYEQINTAYNAGQRLFGESKVQEAIIKIKKLNEEGKTDICWHFIGHLQQNKINKVLDYFSCIQSIDSIELLEKINKKAARKNKNISIYLQVNIAKETQKFGFEPETLLQSSPKSYQNITIDGIMVMLPYLKDKSILQEHCKDAYKLYKNMQKKIPSIKELSMGMSHDYMLAIQAGSSMVRIGSALFKEE